MDGRTMRKALVLENAIDKCQCDIKDIKELLSDYERFGSEISFRRNKDDRSFSFGSLKYRFRADLEVIMKRVLTEKEAELIELKEKFKIL